ncbi:MAG TPA: GNAT family N-acetyltransferase [Kofleriaceae bacterium]|nr:GNAT family N-acetyltransferase [Kofleriaceae bacterium]
MARFFTPDYVERAMLRDGTVVLLRLVCPEDKTLLRHEFERWSPESRYARFLAPKLQLTDDELEYLCNLDQEDHFAIGAIAEAGEGDGEPVGLGIARFIRLPTQPLEPVTAEAAIAVADTVQRKGLGRLLLMRLCAAAAERDIERFRCEVLVANTSMQALIDAIAPEHTTSTRDGILTIDFAIDAVAPDAQAHETPESTLYKFFRAAAENTVEWTEAVRKLWRR